MPAVIITEMGLKCKKNATVSGERAVQWKKKRKKEPIAERMWDTLGTELPHYVARDAPSSANETFSLQS